MSTRIARLGSDEVAQLRALVQLFGHVFEEDEGDLSQPPDDAYLSALLASDSFAAFVALDENDHVVGGVTLHLLPSYQRAGSDGYIYDVAVAESHRRHGLATALMRACSVYARERGAGVLWVQAHEEDGEAVDFYQSLGLEAEAVRHFEFEPAALAPGTTGNQP